MTKQMIGVQIIKNRMQIIFSKNKIQEKKKKKENDQEKPEKVPNSKS